MSPFDPSASELDKWLESLGLGQYAADFKAHDISFETLPEMTQEDLKECGVVSMGHRKTLLAAAQALKARPPGVVVERSAILSPPVIPPPFSVASGTPDFVPPPPDAMLKSPHVSGHSVSPVSQSELVPQAREKPPLFKRFLIAYRKASGSSMLLSIALHAIILFIGFYLVVSQIVEERKISFGGGDPGPKSDVQHKVKMKTTTAPAPTKRITTTSSLVKVALPDMPSIQMNMGPTVANAMGSGSLKPPELCGSRAAFAGSIHTVRSRMATTW